MKWLMAAFCVLSLQAAVSGKELSIPKERSFTEPVPFLPSELPAGRLHKSVAPEWNARFLHGKWHFKAVPFVKGIDLLTDDGIRQGFFKPGFNDGAWEKQPVPSSWWVTPAWDTAPGKIGYFRRSFELAGNEMRSGGRIVLDFRRVSDRADVRINGKSCGKPHIGRSSGFQYDITPFVKSGKNELAVRVYDYQGESTGWRAHIGGICDAVRLLFVPGKFFVSGAMITPDLKNRSIQIRIQTDSPEPFQGITAEVVGWKDGKIAATQRFPVFRVPEGKKWSELGTVRIPEPRLWSPEDPYLYVLRLRDSAGKTVGYERFGFREFKADGEWLLLNGKKFKPRMFTYSTQWHKVLHENAGHASEDVLRLMKEKLHVNMIRPHSMEGTPLETLYEICDQLGMLVYFDWGGPNGYLAYDKKWNDSILESAPDLEGFIRDNYNRPSIVMWSLGNEIYESHYNLYFSKNLDQLYAIVKKLDRQNRPVCSSTGRWSIEALSGRLLKERTDVMDDHQYRGSYCGSWQENIAHIDHYASLADKYFGRPLPKINAEYGVPGDCARYRGDTTVNEVVSVLKMPRDTVGFKEAYAKLLRAWKPETGGYLRFKSNYATPDDYIRKKPLYRKYASRYAKRPMEIYRRAGVKCLGGHINAEWTDLFCNFPEGYDIPNISYVPRSEWRVMPLFYTMARCYNPTFVSAGVFNQQPYAGRTEKIEVFVTNDLNEDARFEVVPQFRSEAGAVRIFPRMDFGTVPAMGQKSLVFEYKTPETGKIERGNMEFYLFKNGKRVGDNLYDIAVFPARNVTLPPKCAVYDSAGLKFRGLLKTPTTMSVLRRLGARTENIRDFKRIGEFSHLIIGTNCFDRTVIENGDRIFRWVETGGKLLVMEQSLCGKVPFLANYSIVAGNPGTFVTIVDPENPVFGTLRQDELDSWFGNLGRMAHYALTPLDAGMSALIPMAASGDRECYKAVLCDVKVGRGEVILSQIAASDRIRRSGAAGEYMASLLEYFARPDVSRFALEVPNASSGKALFLGDDDAFFIDLSKFANRSFTDDGSGNGWTGFGAGTDLRKLPSGKTRLQGGVPFRIIAPGENGGKSCIVLKGEKRPHFPAKVTGIPVNALLNSIYVLHTAMYAGEPGVAVRYVLRYEDGKTQEFAADTRYDLPDWWQAQDRRNARTVFRDGDKCVFLSEFINPRPNAKIVSMDIVSGGKSIPVVIAITGRKRLSSTISGVGEK